MTKEERAEKARLARVEAARKRSEAIERAQVARIRSVWDHIPPDIQRVFEYIEREIPRRDPSDVVFLRETRSIHFSPYRRYLSHADSP